MAPVRRPSSGGLGAVVAGVIVLLLFLVAAVMVLAGRTGHGDPAWTGKDTLPARAMIYTNDRAVVTIVGGSVRGNYVAVAADDSRVVFTGSPKLSGSTMTKDRATITP